MRHSEKYIIKYRLKINKLNPDGCHGYIGIAGSDQGYNFRSRNTSYAYKQNGITWIEGEDGNKCGSGFKTGDEVVLILNTNGMTLIWEVNGKQQFKQNNIKQIYYELAIGLGVKDDSVSILDMVIINDGDTESKEIESLKLDLIDKKVNDHDNDNKMVGNVTFCAMIRVPYNPNYVGKRIGIIIGNYPKRIILI